MARKFGNGIDLLGQRGENFADATSPTDAVNLGQIQAFLRGLRWKEPARASSTTNVVLATPGTTIDGVTLAATDRILLKNQTTPSENGIYVWSGAAVPLTRALDADSAAELVGATVTVTEGNQVASANPAGAQVYTQTAEPITLGTTPLVWALVGGGSVAYTNGNGLDLTGTSFSVKAGNGIIVDATGVRVDPSVVTRKYAATVGGSTSIPVTHGLATEDVQVTVWDGTTKAEEFPDVIHTSASVVTLVYAVAPAAASKRVLVEG